MGSHGVIHNDIRPANVIVTPSCAYLIDFGHAIIRSQNTAPKEWDDEIFDHGDAEATRLMLHHQGVRDMTPFLPAGPTDNNGKAGFAAVPTTIPPSPHNVLETKMLLRFTQGCSELHVHHVRYA